MQRPLSKKTKHHIELCQNGYAKNINIEGELHLDLHKLSTYSKEVANYKDLMTIKPLEGLIESVVDKHQSKSMFGIEEWKFNGIGSYYEFSFEPKKTNCAMKLL